MPLPLASYIIATHAFFFREDDAVASVVATASRARTTNVATIVTAAAHGLWTGASVVIAGLGGVSYNVGPVAVTVLNATTFTYPNVAANEATTPDTGGTVTLTGTASRSFKPGPNDPSWINMGIIEDASDNVEPGEAKEVWGPSPGQLVLKDVLRVKPKLEIKFTCGETGPFHLECLYRTLPLDDGSTQFNPFEGAAKKGWLKLQRYDSKNNLRMVMDLFVELSISGEVNMGGQDIVKPQFSAMVLFSTLNTATI